MGRLLSADSYLCTRSSQAGAEPLLGTATSDVDTWLVLEEDSRWGPRVETADTLGEALSQHLQDVLAKNPRVRLQLIRRTESGQDGWRLLVAHSGGQRPWIRELRLERHSDLLEIDVNTLLSGGFPEDARVVETPLLLVCTHGKRDPCCARWGCPLFDVLRASAPDHTWRTSHLGGHRFAPTMLILPWGYMLGRVPLDAAPAVWRSVLAGELSSLDLVRGRTCWSSPVQAADVIFRREMSELRLGAVAFQELRPLGSNHWEVDFRLAESLWTVLLGRREGEELIQGSCHKPNKLKYGVHWSGVVRAA